MGRSVGRKWLRGLLIAAVLVLVAGALFNYLYIADLRPDSLVEDTTEARKAGAERLEALAAAHGATAWTEYRVMDIRFSDIWEDDWIPRSFMHWEESPQGLRGRFLRGTWTGELELLDGPEQGHRWGIQSWKTWRAKPGGSPEFVEDEMIEFVVPTTQYFLELPLRIETATIALEAGQGEWDGKTYDLVFATWGSSEPTKRFDQYLLWIDPKTGLLARTDYTVRDQAGGAVGSAQYSDYEDFGGVKLAKTIAVFAAMPGGNEVPVHRFVTESVAWDTTPVDALRPDPRLPAEGQSKPGS